MTALDTLPDPADHPLLSRRAVWLLTGRNPDWLEAARVLVATPKGPLMRWRARERLLQVVHTDALDDTMLALLDQGAADMTLVCEPGLLLTTTHALRRALPNLLEPPPENALRASEQTPPFTALLPRLQQPEPSLAYAWLRWAAERDLPNAELPAATAEIWRSLATGTGKDEVSLSPALQQRVSAAAQALADWSDWFSASFAPGELAASFSGTNVEEGDTTTPVKSQPDPLLRPFRPRKSEDGWKVLRPELPSAIAGQALAAAAASATSTTTSWQATGQFSGPARDGQQTELGCYALMLGYGGNLQAEVTLNLAALDRPPRPGQTLALAVRAADGLSLRLRGPAGTTRPAGGSWAIRLDRQLSQADAARLRQQPASGVVAELWWAPST